MDKDSELAKRFGLQVYEDLSQFSFVKEKISKIPYAFAKEHGVLPVEQRGETLLVAFSKPGNLQALEELRCLIRAPIEEIFCPHEVLEEAIQECYHQHQGTTSLYIEDLQKEGRVQDDEEGYDLLQQTSDAPVVRILNAILLEALQQGASDIHFEPQEQVLSVRYRIDGVLQHRHSPSKEYRSQLITRLKVMAKLDIAEHRLPQDGRIKLRMGGRSIDFRMSTVPVVYGERVVLRILDKGNVVLGLEKIGMPTLLL
ncbi:MAG: type II secretion system protein GspE, partial [Chlamydiae bacterium]|nr:type II secretion system protein GspE [Chlamydiota bacterium]